MRKLLVEYLDDFERRGDDIAFARRRGLRTQRWTYSQVARQALLFADQLAAKKIEKRDRVIICGENSAEWVAAFFGCLERGAIAVPLDVQSDPEFVRRVQQQTDAKVAFLDAETCKRIQLTLPVIPLEQDPPSRTLQPSAADGHSSREGSEDDLAEIVYTSGTSSDPKGVRITNRNLLSNLIPLEQEIGHYLKWERLFHPIRFLNLLPLSHIFGQFMGLFVPQMLAAEVFFHESLNTSQIISTIKRQRISVVVCVPRQLEMLRERVEQLYESGWLNQTLQSAQSWGALKRWWTFRKVHLLFGLKFWAFISGGATLDPELEEFWHQLGFVVIQGYGMTETASLISVNHPFKRRGGSVGKILPGQEVTLADDGEILIRGKNVSPGYWRGDQPAPLENGWFATGDVGEFDESGRLYFKGRKKDVIVTAAGMNVYPEDIEHVLRLQPEIKDAVVIPFSSSRGPEPFAVLLVHEELQNSQELINRVNESLASHQRVLHWSIWPEPDFPRTSTGKIRKQIVSQQIARAERALPRASGIQQLIARISGEGHDNLGADVNLATDLKFDSLARVELLTALEDRYEIEIDDASVSSAQTVGDVERIVRERKTSTGDNYPYPRWAMRFPLSLLRIVLLYLIIFPYARIMGRPKILGLKNLSASEGPLVFVANHMSKVDHALVQWALPGRFRRRLAIAMDGELLRDWVHPPTGTSWFMRWRQRAQYFLVVLFFNVFAMPQHGSFRRSFEFAGELIENDYNVLVFPEGRRSPDGKLHQFKTGIGLLVKGLGVPVVPIRVDGLYELAQQRRHIAPRGAITVHIGSPLTFDSTENPEVIAQSLERHVSEL